MASRLGGFGTSVSWRSGNGTAATTLQQARHFSSWSASPLKKKLRELLAESKELSFKDYLYLSIGTPMFAYLSWSNVSCLAEYMMKIYSSFRDDTGHSMGGGSDRDSA